MTLKIIDRVSYSSLINLKDCGWFYKLIHIELKGKFPDSMDTHFGKILHKYLQVILEKKNTETAPLLDAWRLEWQRLWSENQSLVTPKDNFEGMNKVGENVVQNALAIFEKEFPYKEVVAVEQRLEEPIFPDKYKQYFKGFVDIVFKLEDGTYVVGDIKTCASAYMFKKYQDKYKEYQLTLYKYFYAQKFGIDPDKIETFFILVEKNPDSKKPIQFSKVTSGKVKVQNALEWVDKSLATINRSIFMKNRMHCHAYGKDCIFLNTEHCKK